MTRIVVLLALLGTPVVVFAQSPTPEWVSPTSSGHGWVSLKFPGLYRYYQIEANTIRIMDGPYSSTVALTIPLEAGEESPALLLQPFMADVSGDGLYDIVL